MYIRPQLFLGINYCQTSLKVAVLEQVWDKGILAHLKTGSDYPTMALFWRTRFRYADRVSAVASSQSWWRWLYWKEMELPFHNFDPVHLPKRPQYKWGKVDAISVGVLRKPSITGQKTLQLTLLGHIEKGWIYLCNGSRQHTPWNGSIQQVGSTGCPCSDSGNRRA